MRQSPQLLFSLVVPGRYETTRLLHIERANGEDIEQSRIRLVLEGGYELDIPVTPDAMQSLAKGLGNWLRPGPC
jgi:hypothetical protein